MDYVISENKLIDVIDRWIDLEFPTSLKNITINDTKNLIIFRDDNDEVTFKYYYDNHPNGVIRVRKNHLIVGMDIEESFNIMFGDDNLPYLGKWFELKTNHTVKSIS